MSMYIENSIEIKQHLSVVQLTVYVNLSLCDVASQIRNGMGDICK